MASDRFQLSAYANYAWTRAFHDTVDGTTAPPETFAGPLLDQDAVFQRSKLVGVLVEGIHRLLSPYTDPFGLAVYFEPTIGNELFEFESKIIFQKNFLDDRLVAAVNVTVAQELRLLKGDPFADPTGDDFATHWDKETDINLSFGISYRFIENWAIGLEFMNEREFASFELWRPQDANNSAFYIGPNIHYGGEHFFITVTFLEQLPWASDYSNPPANVLFQGRNFADDFEKYRDGFEPGGYSEFMVGRIAQIGAADEVTPFLSIPAIVIATAPAHSTVYLSTEQLQRAIFPGASFTSTSNSGVWRVSNGGYLIVDQVVGKHENIKYAVGINSNGSIKQIEIMEYRESYGHEVRNASWRSQFVGKNAHSALQLNADIKNKSGATLSSKHVTDGVRRIMRMYETSLKGQR